jgi:secreted trypsin-like serine protease
VSVRIGHRRPGRGQRSRALPRYVVTLLVALALGPLGAASATAALAPTPGPDGVPEVSSPPPPDSVKIVGGTDVPDAKYPFQAALGIRFEGVDLPLQPFCGGALISPSHVLTAAHCAQAFGTDDGQLPISDLRVVVGRTVLTSGQGQERGVHEIAIHPQWQPSTFRNDVAVITLDRPVIGIRPIRPVPPGVVAFERPGRDATALGWGNTIPQPVDGGDGGSVFPSRMQEVSVPVVSSQECGAALTFDGVQLLDPSTMLCAGRTGRDTCQGDSGGPLFVRTVTGKFTLVGITSWGVGCGAAGFPGVYTRLSNPDIGFFVLTTVVCDRLSRSGPAGPADVDAAPSELDASAAVDGRSCR